MNQPLDIIDLVLGAYRALFKERAYLIRLAAIPLVIMFMNFIVVSLVFPDLPPLRRGLAMFPAMLAEAWVVVQFLRTVMTDERWPVRLPANFSGPLPRELYARARGLLSSLLYYFLISMLMNVFAALIMTMLITAKEQGATDLSNAIPSHISLVMLAVMILFLLNFRFVWLYIALVVNVPIWVFVNATKARLVNFQLLGLWLATLTPLMFLSLVFIQPLLGLTKGDDIGSYVAFIVAAFLSVLTQLVLALATSTATTFALAPLLFPQKKSPR